MNIGEMDVAELAGLLWDISERLRAIHKECPEDAPERDALWEAGYRVSVASDKAGEALAEGGLI